MGPKYGHLEGNNVSYIARINFFLFKGEGAVFYSFSQDPCDYNFALLKELDFTVAIS
jgi:hypothetical protein